MMWEALLGFLYHHPDITLLGAVTLIQVAPIKINPWSAVGKWLRHVITGGISEKLVEIAGKVDKVEAIIEEREAVLARTHILRFNDEIYNDVKHSKDYFDQTLEDIDRYEKYCREHPKFENNRTVIAAKNITETYNRLMAEHKFL